jgi:hypothetical protein
VAMSSFTTAVGDIDVIVTARLPDIAAVIAGFAGLP